MSEVGTKFLEVLSLVVAKRNGVLVAWRWLVLVPLVASKSTVLSYYVQFAILERGQYRPMHIYMPLAPGIRAALRSDATY